MSRTRTPEEKAARYAGVRVTVWRLVHEALLSGEHVIVHWFDRTYNGHITEISPDGFRVLNYEDGGAFCSWEGASGISPPDWDIEQAVKRDYPAKCPGCVAFVESSRPVGQVNG